MQIIGGLERRRKLGGERRQQKRRQDRDDGDDHQQFNQCKTLDRSISLFGVHLFVVSFVNADIILFICLLEILRPIVSLRFCLPLMA